MWVIDAPSLLCSGKREANKNQTQFWFMPNHESTCKLKTFSFLSFFFFFFYLLQKRRFPLLSLFWFCSLCFFFFWSSDLPKVKWLLTRIPCAPPLLSLCSATKRSVGRGGKLFLKTHEWSWESSRPWGGIKGEESPAPLQMRRSV